MARVALFDESAAPGERVLAQLRLEERLVARCGDRFVIRSYSPVTTIAGGTVLEPTPPKRKRLSERERAALARLAQGGVGAVRGAVALAGWSGLDAGSLAVQAGVPPERFAEHNADDGDTSDAAWRLGSTLIDPDIVTEGEARLLAAVEAHHDKHPLEAGAPLAELRIALPPGGHKGLADGLVARMVAGGRLVVRGKLAWLPGFKAKLSPQEAELAERLRDIIKRRGVARTHVVRANRSSRGRRANRGCLALHGGPRSRELGRRHVLDQHGGFAARRPLGSSKSWGGRGRLGPADFREVLPVTRRHLIPLLAYLDGLGVTVRGDGGRQV